MMKIKNNWFAFLLLSSVCYGQEFDYQTSLKKVNYTGFHKIVLSPELLGKLNENQTDVRIYDSIGVEIPYLHEQENQFEYQSLFKEYKIVEKNYAEHTISYLIFHNPDKKAIDNVSFIVKNTDVRKRARLSGSDDKVNWYVIKNDYLLHSMYDNSDISELKILNFPRSNYAFFKLEINDYWKLPINILKVGYYDTKSIEGTKIEFNIPITSQIDSAKTSFIRLDFPEEMYLENLKFELEGAEYYLRKGSVSIKETSNGKRKKKKTFFREIKSFEINSNNENEIYLGPIVAKTLYLEIYNQDNQPLKLKSIKGSYLKKYLLANLASKNEYTLKFGNINLVAPQYDLANFRATIPEDIATVQHEIIKAKTDEPKVKTTTEHLFENKYFIWGIIAFVGLVLLLISLKMVKEMSNK